MDEKKAEKEIGKKNHHVEKPNNEYIIAIDDMNKSIQSHMWFLTKNLTRKSTLLNLTQLSISGTKLEYEKAVSKEIRRLSNLLNTTRETLSSRNEQFDELRDTFVHNLKLFEIKENQFNQLALKFSTLKSNFDQQTVQLRNTKSSLEHCQSELMASRKMEAILKHESLTMQNSMKEREIQLINQHESALKALNRTHFEKQDGLETEIKTLRQTIDAEHLKAERELEQALRRVWDKSEEQTNKAKQKQIELDMKLRVCEQKFEKLKCTKQELETKLQKSKHENESLRLDYWQTCEQVKSLLREIKDGKVSIQLENKKCVELEEAKQKAEVEQTHLNCQLKAEIEKLKNQLHSLEEEIHSQRITHEQASNKTASRVKELTEVIGQEQQKQQSLLNSLEESRMARQVAETKAFEACAEVERLRKDLQRLLLPSSQPQLPTKVSENVCEYKDLVEQTDRLQRQYDELAQENAKLRRALNSNLKKENLSNQSNLVEKLQLAKRIIGKLADENQALIELSNRLQSQLRESMSRSTQRQNKLNDKNQCHRAVIPQQYRGNKEYRCNKQNPESDGAFSSMMDKDSVKEIFKLLDDNTSSLLFDCEIVKDGLKPNQNNT